MAPISPKLYQEWESALVSELRYAIDKTSSNDLEKWGKQIPETMATVALRRGKNFGSVLNAIAEFFVSESRGVMTAFSQDRLSKHVLHRGEVASDTLSASIKEARDTVLGLSDIVSQNPEREAPRLLVGVLGMMIGSGGIDGDGGVPDLDFLGGIGAHRSIFTHSIIAGTVIETTLLSVANLIKTVQYNLPENHQPFWEEFVEISNDYLDTFSTGVSAGIAYHLGIDGALDSDGTYKDLPFSIPQEGHNVIILGNATAEGVDAIKKFGDSHGNKKQALLKEFSDFKSAAEYLKANIGGTLKRSSTGHGFTVEYK